MTVIEQRPHDGAATTQRPTGRDIAVAAGAFVVLLLAFWFAWPLGVALGLIAGVLATVRLGQRMHASAQAEPVAGSLADSAIDDELWQEFRRLRVRLGDDWPAFSAAAVVVTRAQSASASLLRRELSMSTSQAQQTIALLEQEGFVGPARGTQPRTVRVDRDQAETLQELLQG